ncbi:MAG: nicotinate phosphoribosyltransferase [Paludibacteraceae bacterium]|jgi:nicotinate phosphoribosyltransferase|nr:nicotinate phosphoribosyltransferase [Paludibacteraceae bacterium]MBO5988194.1 nicotinate phosphoribosyltransferase [Paludibacteraceae bacterium]
MEKIMTSLLETDLYKFSMGQAIFHQFPSFKTTWSFKCRNKDVKFTTEMVAEIKHQLSEYCKLRFTEDELEYLRNIGVKRNKNGNITKKGWIKDSYIDFLRIWHPRYEEFEITDNAECGLSIEAKGTWLNTSMYEIPTLAIVNEVYFKYAYNYDELLAQFETKLNAKVANLEQNIYELSSFSEFGLRRRLSAECQEMAVKKLKEAKIDSKSTFVGTSNVYLAKKHGLMPVGTMAHEWIMCVGQGNRAINPAYSNLYAMRAWVNEFKVQNGTVLTDTITTDCFLRDFDEEFATVFSGVRHDSGDPFVWGDKMIEHYKNLGIDPLTKTLLFSDSLNFEKATKLKRYFDGKAKVAFGIGTYLANDTDVPPLNIVMKTTCCNGGDVAKISDTPGKGMCKDPDYVDYLQRSIDWRMNHAEMY